MKYITEHDLAQQVAKMLSPVIAERDRLVEEVKKLEESNKNLRQVLSRCGVGYKN